MLCGKIKYPYFSISVTAPWVWPFKGGPGEGLWVEGWLWKPVDHTWTQTQLVLALWFSLLTANLPEAPSLFDRPPRKDWKAWFNRKEVNLGWNGLWSPLHTFLILACSDPKLCYWKLPILAGKVSCPRRLLEKECFVLCHHVDQVSCWNSLSQIGPKCCQIYLQTSSI